MTGILRIDLQPAWILHTRAYRDTSLLVDVLTLDFGLLRCVARGARGTRSRRKTLLQAFQPLLLSLSGRGELLTLGHAEPASRPVSLSGRSLFSAIYINELLVRLLHPFEEHPELFRAYRRALMSLYGGMAEETVLRIFEWQLLETLGYAINTRYEGEEGARLEDSAYYRFSAISGFQPVSGQIDTTQSDIFSGLHIAKLQRYMDVMCDETPTQEAGAPEFDRELAGCAKRLMRLALRPLLGNKPLMSRTLFR